VFLLPLTTSGGGTNSKKKTKKERNGRGAKKFNTRGKHPKSLTAQKKGKKKDGRGASKNAQ